MPGTTLNIDDFDISPNELPPGTFYIPPVSDTPGKKPDMGIPDIHPDVIKWDQERKRRREQPDTGVPVYIPVPEYGSDVPDYRKEDPNKTQRGIDFICYEAG